jgi:DMATS type aromatic prenyltransferase
MNSNSTQTPHTSQKTTSKERTYASVGKEQCRRLCQAMGYQGEERVVSFFEQMLSGWGERSIPEQVGWPSDIGDDHTPFEFSLALGGKRSELRLLWEAQGQENTVLSQQEAALSLTARLAQEYSLELGQFEQIAPLYFPKNPQGNFAMWHAASFYLPKSKPELKCYLNPQANGKENAAAVVEETLCRLGFEKAWPALARVACARGPVLDEWTFVALDLTPGSQGRLKVYLRYHHATVDSFLAAASLGKNFNEEESREFCRTFLNGNGPYQDKPLALCFSFTAEDYERPTAVTLYCPVSHYIESDQEVKVRLDGYFDQHQIPREAYDQSVHALIQRPLANGSGAHSYAALRSQTDGLRVTVYLAAELHHVGPIRSGAALPPAAPSAEDIIRFCQENSIAAHPFLQRLRREPVSLSRLYLLMASAHLGISKHFVRWLATTVARVSDDRIRSLLAQQLSDELGNGNPDRRHSLLFDRLLSGLEPWAPRDSRTFIEALGHDLQTKAERHFLSQDPNEAVGALIASEICAEEFDTFLGEEFARQSHLLPRDLAWVVVHTELEPSHAEDSSRIAHFLSDEESLSAAWRGAVGTFVTAWTYLDSLYALCFATPLGTTLREQN